MPDKDTVRPLGLGNVIKLLTGGAQPAPTPRLTAPVMVRDGFTRSSGSLGNARFSGNPELENIAAGRGVLNTTTSPQTVATIQQALQDMAFMVDLGNSGIYGPGTIQAIKNFQHMAGLAVDGSLGPQTLAALDKYAPAPGKTAWDKGQNPGPVPSPNVGYGKKARVVVSISQHRAFLFDKAGNLQKIYGVRTGREQVDTEGNIGHATHPCVKVIDSKNGDPTEVSNALWPTAGGKAFGTRLMGLTVYDPATGQKVPDSPWNGQELHGTYQDQSIGRDFSHGCMGMRNQDAEEVYGQVKVGDLVNVIP